MVKLINQISENTASVCLPCKAKAGTNYAEGKLCLGGVVDSDGSKLSPDSGGCDEDDDLYTKPRADNRAAKTKSLSRKASVLDVDEEEVNEEEVNIIWLLFILRCITQRFCNLILVS